MFGIILGTLCLIALIGVVRRRRYRRHAFAFGAGPWGYGHYGHYGHHRYAHAHGPFAYAGPYGAGYGSGGFGARAGGARFGRGDLHGLLAALETTPGQDRAIGEALETFFERVRDTGKTREAAHATIARALSGDTLDARGLEAGLAQEGELGAELRRELAAGLSRVHEALDSRQRKLLAELIEEGLLARQLGRPR